MITDIHQVAEKAVAAVYYKDLTTVLSIGETAAATCMGIVCKDGGVWYSSQYEHLYGEKVWLEGLGKLYKGQGIEGLRDYAHYCVGNYKIREITADEAAAILQEDYLISQKKLGQQD